MPVEDATYQVLGAVGTVFLLWNVHEAFGRDDNGDRLPVAGRVRAGLDAGSEAPRLCVDGGLALLAPCLDVAPQCGLLGPHVVVGICILVLLSDTRQGSACSRAGSGKTGNGALAYRVEELLGARGTAHDTLYARHEAVIVVGHALRLSVECAAGRLGRLPVALLAVAQVGIVGFIVVAALAPDPGSDSGGCDCDGED